MYIQHICILVLPGLSTTDSYSTDIVRCAQCDPRSQANVGPTLDQCNQLHWANVGK